jgi:hypothetical protein
MFKVQWSTVQMLVMVDRYFSTEEAAMRFARTRSIYVVRDPDGKQIA